MESAIQPNLPSMSPDRHRVLLHQQPVNWWRAILCGMLGAFTLSSMVWLVAGVGLVDFSLEQYLGTLFYTNPLGGIGYRPMIFGFFANLALGGIFGIVYAVFFEYQAKKANVRVGFYLGVFHTLLAAGTVFPAVNVVHEFMTNPAMPGLSPYSKFGFLGYGFSPDLCAALIVGHVLFGVIMGGLYGPVRADRMRMRYAEPGSDLDTWVEQDSEENHWPEAS